MVPAQETWEKIVYDGEEDSAHSWPGERPLDGRINLILTTDKSFKLKGADVCHSVEEVLNRIKWYKEERGFTDEDVFIIGGQSVYEAVPSLL